LKTPNPKFGVFIYTNNMKKRIFKLLAKINKVILPSYSKRHLDLSKASKLQLAIIGWRAFVTLNALD